MKQHCICQPGYQEMQPSCLAAAAWPMKAEWKTSPCFGALHLSSGLWRSEPWGSLRHQHWPSAPAEACKSQGALVSHHHDRPWLLLSPAPWGDSWFQGEGKKSSKHLLLWKRKDAHWMAGC